MANGENASANLTAGGIPNTRGGLVAAYIVDVDKATIENSGVKVVKGTGKIEGAGDINVPCMFNPNEYSLSKSNHFKEDKSPQGIKATFERSDPQTLKLALVFDTYGTEQNLVKIMNDLWRLMGATFEKGAEPTDSKSPPLVAFVWGGFYFVAYITQMTQKFTLFTKEGTPVRADVDIQFTQYIDINDYPGQNPTSGDGPIDRVWQVTGGDRIDTIAHAVYGSAAKWRLIADYNQLHDATQLQSGQQLLIPFESKISNIK